MNCSNCKIVNQNVPYIPQGNDFKIAIVLKEKIKTDGEVSERDIDIAQISSVNVIKPNGDVVDNTQNQVYSYALNGSTLILDFANQEGANALPKGNYGIEVKGVRDDADDSNFRFYLPPAHAFNIVNSTIDGRFPSDSIITYTVNGVVGVALNVSEGGGGEANVIETIKVNGTALQVSNKAVDIPVPDELKDLSDDSTHRTVTDAEKQNWNGKSNFSGNYDDLTNKPTIPSVSNSTIALQVNGEGIGNFTLNQSENASINLSGLEKRLQIVKNPTLDNDDLVAQFGRYYVLDNLEDTVTINLPETSASATVITGLIIYAELPSDGNGGLLFAVDDNEDIVESGLSDIEEGKTYEFNCIWNGTAWAITAVEMKAFTQS